MTTKREAIEQMVQRDLSAVPQEWVRIILENVGYYTPLPMWGTMWIVDSSIGEKLFEHSRVMAIDKEEIDLDEIERKEGEKRRKFVEEAIEDDRWEDFEEYIDEEMSGANCVLDKSGQTTALYVYEVADEYVIGVNGAGWNFYDGVWDKLYELLDYHWHTEEDSDEK